MIYTSADQIIGKTPILDMVNIQNSKNLQCKIFAKLEYLNPTGSVKDRVAKAILDQAEKDGLLNKDTVIIEPTSGNTGIGLASICATRGYKLKIVMPNTMTIERRKLIKAYGAQVILVEGGMKGAIEHANELAKAEKNSFMPCQFENIANVNIHKQTTGREIFDDMCGNIDIFVAGVGTGGTITGVGEYLKSKNPNIKIVAVEPFSSPVLSKNTAGVHKIQGIGAGFVPKILNTDIYDEIITVTDEDAFETANLIANTQGILVGISSGAVTFACIQLAKRYSGKNIVTLLPDSGDRYFSVLAD